MSRNGYRPPWDRWLTIATLAVAVFSAWIWADAAAAPAVPPVALR